jgi:hypothetical protein
MENKTSKIKMINYIDIDEMIDYECTCKAIKHNTQRQIHYTDRDKLRIP